MIITMNPIGTVRSTRQDPTDDNWDKESACIEIHYPEFSKDSLSPHDVFGRRIRQSEEWH